MKISFFDTHQFEKDIFKRTNQKYNFEIIFHETRLDEQTAVLATESAVVCSFVNDKLNDGCIRQLKKLNVKMIALRSAGFNHVDIASCEKYNLVVSRVPGYSPHAIAEFAVGLLLDLNRKIHRSYSRVRELNFSLEGLVGFDLYGKTIGVVGAGKIGRIFAEIMTSFGCRVLIYDLVPDYDLEKKLNAKYTDFETLCRQSDIISLHAPLTPKTHHLVNNEALKNMKQGTFLINTGRGALIDAKALIENLKSGHIGGAALDVYEEEENVFFHDLSNQILQDDILARLLTFPNVLVTSHQAFLTQEALKNIAESTLQSIEDFQRTGTVPSNVLVQSKN